MSLPERLRRWLSNPVLLEWDEPVAWTDHTRRRGLRALREVTRVMAVRSAPLATGLLLLGLWLIGQIPGGAGSLPYRARLLLVATVVAGLCLPHLLVRFFRFKPGVPYRIRLRSRGLEVVGDSRGPRLRPWSQFDLFDFGTWQDLDILKLRPRANWLTRRLHGRLTLAVAFGSPPSAHDLRVLLLDRGLSEEPLGEATGHP